ncbi:MAG: baseplate J/gp47 family protein [Byssovorax sp.]
MGPVPLSRRHTTPLPAVGGADAEPRKLARVRGPEVTSAMDRAVSLADVRALALSFDGVVRARVVREGTSRQPHMVVVAAGPREPVTGDDERDELRRYLLARVPPGVEVVVQSRVLVGVHAQIRLRLLHGADPLKVASDVRLRLGVDHDEALPPGLLDPDNVDLDMDLQLSQVYGALEGVPGLHSCVVMQLFRDVPASTTRSASRAVALRGARAVGTPRIFDRITAASHEMLSWARTTDGSVGVDLPFEEVRDL